MEQEPESTVDTSKFHIAKLNATNYFLWSKKIEIVLRGKGLWDVVFGKETRPTAEAEATRPEPARPSPLVSPPLSIDDTICSTVLELRDSVTVWNQL